MSKRIMKKLRDHSGETIAETLIALLVSALALVMLAGAIGTAARVVTTSENTMQAYYLANNDLATPGDSGGTNYSEKTTKGSAQIKIDKKIANETTGFPVRYAKNPVLGGKPVVAYAK